MKKVLITEAGRATGINVTRCLRMAGEPITVIGLEKDKYSIFNSEADTTLLMPDITRDKEGFIAFLDDVIEREKPDVLYPAKTNEVLWEISHRRERLRTHIFLPDKEKVALFEDKFRTSQLWEKAGLRVPHGMMIHSEDDLRRAFKTIGKRLWFRKIKGCGGSGSIDTDDFDLAKAWINRFDGWGCFMAAECLTRNTTSWSAIWKNGELVVSQIRKRLYWEFPYLSPSGVTGITGAQVTVRDPQLDEIALKAIKTVDDKPHGIISLDFTYDSDGIPNPTEVQASRFFTSMYFMAKGGLNFPYILLKLALNEDCPVFTTKFSPIEPGLVWIKYIEHEPVLTSLNRIEQNVRQLDQTMENIKHR